MTDENSGTIGRYVDLSDEPPADPSDPSGGAIVVDPEILHAGAESLGWGTGDDKIVENLNPGFDVDKVNADNAEARRKAIEEGMDEGTASLVYPDIDPSDPFRIN